MHCSCGNDTDPIWRELASSDGISSWTPLKPQHISPKPYPSGQSTLVYWLPYSSHTSSLTDTLLSLNLLCHSKNWCSIHGKWSKVVWSIPYVSVAFFSSLKRNFIAYCSFKVASHPDCIFAIPLLWQSGFSRVYSNCCCSCSFETKIIK